MFRTSLIVAATASIAFGAGASTNHSMRATTLIPTPALSISPFEMHVNVNRQELPVQRDDHI